VVALLWIDGLLASEHAHELLDSLGPRVSTLGVRDPVQNGVAILTVERLEHGSCPGLRSQSRCEVCWHFNVGAP